MAENSIIWGKLACAALGLDPNRVKSLRIDASPQAPLTVTVELFSDSDELRDAARALTQHVERVRLGAPSAAPEVSYEADE